MIDTPDLAPTEVYLPGQHSRALWMRYDAARILKLFHFCERALVISQAGWLPGVAAFEAKAMLPLHMWQDTLTAHALRDRVYELRYPDRMMEIDADAPLISVFDEAANAPSGEAYILSMARVFKPAMLAAYREYIEHADELADGPILRALRIAFDEKAEQVAVLTRLANQMLRDAPDKREAAEIWVAGLSQRLTQVGGVSIDAPQAPEHWAELPGRRPFALADQPARDAHFQRCRFYWPDIIDARYAYGEGLRLQLRSAVSHLNEVWAVESAGVVLNAFAGDMEWEFVVDAARWTYDESRHMRMGYERLTAWGFEPKEMPLGTHLYVSASGEDPAIRLGMLHYFETKNIGKKPKRTSAFASYQDKMSQHDMDFDWADETIHAHYGRHWLDALRKRYPDRVPAIETIRTTCDRLVTRQVNAGTEADRQEIYRIADAMIAKAEHRGAVELQHQTPVTAVAPIE